MKNEFVPYEIALELKELGFESPYPIGGYQSGSVFYYEKGELYYDGRPMYSPDSHSGQLLAPLFQQAFRWFREKYKYDITIPPSGDSNGNTIGYYYEIIFQGWGEGIESDSYETHEEAELECLKKLIKITKEKK